MYNYFTFCAINQLNHYIKWKAVSLVPSVIPIILNGQVLKLINNSRKVKRLTTLFVLPGLSTENLSWPFSQWASSITCHQMSLGTIPYIQVQQHIVIWHPGMTECSQQCDPNPELLVGGGGKEEEYRWWMIFYKRSLKTEQHLFCSEGTSLSLVWSSFFFKQKLG